MLQSVIHRAALGRAAKIGALYDMRTERFLGDTLFSSKLEDDAIDTMDLGETSIELVMTDNLQEKFSKMNVEAELQMSLLSGLVKLSGSGAYLGEERKSARAQCMSLLYKLKTVNEEIMIRQNKDKIDTEILSPSNGRAVEATHAVVAIDWGAVFSVTCEYKNKEDDDSAEVKNALSVELGALKELIEGKISATAASDGLSNERHKKFIFKCKADVSAPDKDMPVTFEDAVELGRNFHSLVNEKNNGKGVPLTYMLMPLSAIGNMCKFQMHGQIQYRIINDDIIKKCVQVVEEIAKKRQTFYDIHNDLHAYADYIAEESLEKIDDILETFSVKESSFKARLQYLVQKVRSGHEDVSSLETLLSKELCDTFSVSRCNDQIKDFEMDCNKVKCIKSWKMKGIVYIGKKDDITVDDRRNVYVFYKTSDEDEKDNNDRNQEFFLRIQKTHAQDDKNVQFIVVDQDLRKDLWPNSESKPTIHKFESGTQTSTDLYAEEGQDTEMCLIQIATPSRQRTRPSNRAHVKLRCPNALSGNGKCAGNPVTWMCSQCKQIVVYGIETQLFHCKCGQSDPMEALFRCNEKDHGMDYFKYPDDILTEELSIHRAMKEKNILILGETGVGKSTWINGFINYIYFADMEEAMNAKEFNVLIPSSFTFTQQGEEKKIMVGESDPNENVEVGKSATKEPRSYVFYVGEQIVRLIDTPGVGDSEGIQQDKKNFDNILSYLSNYEEIHAVCILLKPNNSRLTAMFRFCIQELLAHLHSSAKDNIVFCFTNARGTFYQPGDTLPALNKELDKRKVGIRATPHNYFCFDNEPFRFLACLKNGVRFCQSEILTYSESWNKCVEETKRLFDHINTLTSHKVRNTLSMNEARRVIVAMSKPLAEVARTIQQNVHQGNEVKNQIDLDDRDMDSLKAGLKFSGFGLKRVELGYPRTVCAHSSCIKHVPVGESGVQNTIYEQICHHHCHLNGIPTETTNDKRLQGCACMSGNYCHQCNHHYTTHMHITYNTEVFPEEFLSKAVQAQINQKQNAKETKEALKRAIDIKNRELMEEENIIMKTSAKYGSFLKANAIIPYNDAVGDYLDMCIEQERNKVKAIRNDALLSTMQNMKSQYEHERKILDSAIDKENSENIHTPEEVMKLQKELFGLKHMGQTLKDLFNGISISNSANSIKFQEKTAPIRPRQNLRRKAKRTWREAFPSQWWNFVYHY